ncbi:efflux RND transporter periplasmic adaptor subunit [Thermodesulfobacteriota bacterium]
MRSQPIPGVVKGLAIIIVAGLLIAAISGCEKKIEPGRFEDSSGPPVTLKNTDTVKNVKIMEWYEAVGTVRPKTETSIEAQVTAQVLDVKVNPGNTVTKGQLLIALDSRQMKSRRDQAQQALESAVAGKKQAQQAIASAMAAFKQAEADYQRVQKYFKSQAATAQDLERSESTFLQAQAEAERAREGLSAAEAGIRQADAFLKESNIALGYSQIKASEAGVILQRFVEPGDLALPGKPLLTLRTAGALRLEAYVREGLITQVNPGQQLRVDLHTLNQTVDATVEEIIPYADPQTRTFLVKAGLPALQGLYPGMFGKLLIPIQEHRVIMVPQAAIRHIGQLELIYVKEGTTWQSRYIKAGRQILGANVEVLSGLKGDETIGWEVKANG